MAFLHNLSFWVSHNVIFDVAHITSVESFCRCAPRDVHLAVLVNGGCYVLSRFRLVHTDILAAKKAWALSCFIGKSDDEVHVTVVFQRHALTYLTACCGLTLGKGVGAVGDGIGDIAVEFIAGERLCWHIKTDIARERAVLEVECKVLGNGRCSVLGCRLRDREHCYHVLTLEIANKRQTCVGEVYSVERRLLVCLYTRPIEGVGLLVYLTTLVVEATIAQLQLLAR